jgi:integrase
MTETSDTKTVLELSTPKTKNSIRDIYMFQSFAEEVKAYKEKMIVWKKEKRYLHSEDDFVFIGMKGKPIEPRVFYKYYQEVMKIADVEDANFHTLRHTFATRCIENGMDILMVSRTLGHSNISTTLNKYSHLLPKHQKACMDKLETIYF